MRPASFIALLASALLAPSAMAGTSSIVTVGGTGSPGSAGDGGLATAGQLNGPSGISAVPSGGFVIADQDSQKVRRVAANGNISTLAGDGSQCGVATNPCGDGGTATSAQLQEPTDVTPGATVFTNGFVFSDSAIHRVRLVNAGGNISTVAGTGVPCAAPANPCGDGGLATAAQLKNPGGIALPTPDGGFLIADQGDHRIRKVSAGGAITTVAGSGTACANPVNTCGDGAAATAAQLNNPFDVAVTTDGGFLIADALDHRIRKVSAAGTITTVAGTGAPGTAGDGGPAPLAQINTPTAVAPTPDGGFAVAEFAGNRVRHVSAGGVITTLAGTGAQCAAPTNTCGDGGLAVLAQLRTPGWVATAPGGDVFVSDTGDNRIRLVDSDFKAQIPGAAGSAGAPGQSSPGPDGAPGANGAPGTTGATGPAGKNGTGAAITCEARRVKRKTKVKCNSSRKAAAKSRRKARRRAR